MDLNELQRTAHNVSRQQGLGTGKALLGDRLAYLHVGLSRAMETYRDNALDSWIEAPAASLEGWGWVILGDGLAVRDVPVRVANVPRANFCGVGSDLADIVLQVADLAEDERVDLSYVTNLCDHPLTPAQEATFGDWITRGHMLLGPVYWQYEEHGGPGEGRGPIHGPVPEWHLALAEFYWYVSDLAARHGVDLDAAIARTH